MTSRSDSSSPDGQVVDSTPIDLSTLEPFVNPEDVVGQELELTGAPEPADNAAGVVLSEPLDISPKKLTAETAHQPSIPPGPRATASAAARQAAAPVVKQTAAKAITRHADATPNLKASKLAMAVAEASPTLVSEPAVTVSQVPVPVPAPEPALTLATTAQAEATTVKSSIAPPIEHPPAVLAQIAALTEEAAMSAPELDLDLSFLEEGVSTVEAVKLHTHAAPPVGATNDNPEPTLPFQLTMGQTPDGKTIATGISLGKPAEPDYPVAAGADDSTLPVDDEIRAMPGVKTPFQLSYRQIPKELTEPFVVPNNASNEFVIQRVLDNLLNGGGNMQPILVGSRAHQHFGEALERLYATSHLVRVPHYAFRKDGLTHKLLYTSQPFNYMGGMSFVVVDAVTTYSEGYYEIANIILFPVSHVFS